MPTLVAALATLSLAGLATPNVARADTVPADGMRAANAVPPGESGFISLSSFAAVQAGAQSSYGPNFADQLPLYANWQYKPMQFQRTGTGTNPGGNAAATVYRDSSGVPQIYAASEDDLFYAMGYAMAQDRLFQMEAFRHVGHGTLAELTGASGIPMDEAVRRVSEGAAARTAELQKQPASVRSELSHFTAGINQYISEASTDPSKMPAEFVLLNDLPIKPWADDDTLAFGEYAGRFFGEFGHGELGAAKTYLDLVAKLGQPAAEKAFADLYPLDDPRAPHTIPDSSGTFPRHTGANVPGGGGAAGSPYVNHDPATLPPSADVASVEKLVDGQAATVSLLQRVLAIPRWGSNAIVESGSRTDNGNPRLYGGPQTGWAVPGFFWEVELHDPQRDQRGVTVPAIPLLVIGRNSDTAWTVTSGLDANSDLFVEQLDSSNNTYTNKGATRTVDAHSEQIGCNNPPTAAVGAIGFLRGGASGSPPATCPVMPTTINVYHTVHGAALADPDSTHHLYVRQSAIDGNLVTSLLAWDRAGQQHDPAAFGSALSSMALCFNFFYVDGHGTIGYWHVGKLPIRPGNVDPGLPMPGSGAYDWQGYEAFADMPHAVNPATGYLVNWNNKPARGWWSKSLDGVSTSVWGDEDQVSSLAAVVGGVQAPTFERFSLFARDVAYLDNRARVFMPYLTSALAASSDARLQALLPALREWDMQRVDRNGDGKYDTPAVVFFDRFVQFLLTGGLDATIGNANTLRLSGMSPCAAPPRCLTSVDNLLAPTLKFELNAEEVLLAALRGETSYDWFAAGGGAQSVLRTAAVKAADQLVAEQGGDVSKWNQTVETGDFSAQGAGSAQALAPLPNRGSYAQVAEPVVARSQGSGATGTGNVQSAAAGGGGAIGLVNTTGVSGDAAAAGLAAVGLTFAGAVAARKRRGWRSR
ncbi:MAG TPA: penicillin acylase family protein [Candidatus Dormibacteraeota bacterium]|nr:penicillin acylase family protein [Candidatus Dormibacteraeota bacterium]